MYFVRQAIVLYREKEHAKIGHTTKFQSCRPNACEIAGNLKMRDKCMTVRLGREERGNGGVGVGGE